MSKNVQKNEDIMAPKGNWSPLEDITNMEILNSLLSPENIELKSDIKNIAIFTRLKTQAFYLRSIGWEDVANLIEEAIKNYLLYSVSKNRLSRAETIQGVTQSQSNEVSLKERLLGDLKDK